MGNPVVAATGFFLFMNPSPLAVSAALVFQQGRLLISQRLPNDHLGGLWEFPGGKRELGESGEQCLRRELREELDIEVDVGPRVECVEHAYPDRTVRLEFFLCRLPSGVPRAVGCQAIAWVGPGDLSQYSFPPADQHLLDRLRVEAAWWRGEWSGR